MKKFKIDFGLDDKTIEADYYTHDDEKLVFWRKTRKDGVDKYDRIASYKYWQSVEEVVEEEAYDKISIGTQAPYDNT